MYGGAYQGTYDVEVYSAAYGRYIVEAELEVQSTVQSILPNSGSIMGGTLITI